MPASRIPVLARVVTFAILAPLSVFAMAASPQAAASAASAGAHEAAAAPAESASKPSMKPVTQAAADAAAVPTKAVGPIDPIEHLQQRLAQTLGANRKPDGHSPFDMQVVARAEAAPRVARISASPAAHEPMDPQAAKPGVTPASPGAHAHWSYAGNEGPQAWAQLAPEYAKCAAGERQSPIDIRGGLPLDLEPVQFEYRPSSFSVLDNGHTVQVNVSPGNSINVLGRRYELVQFHFHRPSEERIDGRAFDMVAHLVHKDVEGRLAVVAVLLDRGSAQPLVQAVWNNLPLEKGEEQPARVTIDLARLLPEDRRYFTYMGSLTTPPCSEGVLWMVMKQPVQISAQQIEIFSRLYPMNARPIQAASGRLIKESN